MEHAPHDVIDMAEGILRRHPIEPSRSTDRLPPSRAGRFAVDNDIFDVEEIAPEAFAPNAGLKKRNDYRFIWWLGQKIQNDDGTVGVIHWPRTAMWSCLKGRDGGVLFACQHQVAT